MTQQRSEWERLWQERGLDYYQILGAHSTAKPHLIDAIFQAQIETYRPDNRETGDAKKLAMIKEAYEVLSNPTIRAWYDEFCRQKTDHVQSSLPLVRALAGVKEGAWQDVKLPPRLWREKLDMELCLVPAGEFLMGSPRGEGKDDESRQHTVHLDAYYIGRYPVTQAQYARFVQEANYPVPFGDWDSAKPYNWHQKRKTPPKGKENHPVVLVSWRDAVAFCEWAELRLPTEAEWEKAARGTDGRIYPWGNEWNLKRCNSFEGGKGGTTPVGAYSPSGDSPYGCADMAGNVWEWTSSLKRWYPYQAHDGREDLAASGFRVLRGGSFEDWGGGIRCAYRSGYNPDFGFDLIGFRVAVSPDQAYAL